jgi:chromate transporter
MSVALLYWVFLRATLLSFSGFASVPLLREALVLQHAVLTDTQLNDAIAISQASPGPLGLYVVIAGYFAAGVPGAVAGMLALATPAVLAVPISSLVMRGRAAELHGASTGIVIASCALMLAVGLRLAPEATPTPTYLAIAVVGFVVLAFTNVKPLWVVLAAACCGLVI